MSLVSAVCCYVEVSATSYSLVERRHTECAYEARTMKRPWPTRGCRAMEYTCNKTMYQHGHD